jgi:hypothetical protein
MTKGTIPATRPPAVAVAATRQEAPRGVILGATVAAALLFAGIMGMASHWEGGIMFVVMLVACGLSAVGWMIDDDRGARIWVQENILTR